MSTVNSILYFIFLNWKQQIIHKKEFLIRFFLTAANSITLFVFWIAYSHQYPAINGWTLKEIAVLYAVTHMVMGWLSMLGVGSLDLISYYRRGEMSREMNDPGPAFVRLLIKGSSFQGFSSLFLGVLYYLYSGYMTGAYELILILLVSLFGGLVMISFFAALNSFAIAILDASVLIDQIYEVTLLFMMYPKNLFGGAVKIICMTVVPVFWIVHFPAEYVLNPTWKVFSILISVLFLSVTICVFSLKRLKNYILLHGD